MDAAVNGQGVALVPRIFLHGHPLEQVWQAPLMADTGFYVVWSGKKNSSASQTVVNWLLSQTGDSDATDE